ncbi:MAG: tetratricopeptide repeat protein [Oculatellaceae cyanobacterium Prado106]|nr:tetratricopeptide repeat protein [Oculatellaceae cyanobacterium Prado106]
MPLQTSSLIAIALFICLGWMVSLCLHEYGHAITAYWGGDTSVKEKGYLTLNPLKYTDPGLSLLLPLFFLLMGGIALPGGAVYINHSRLRGRGWKSLVSAAGPLANIVVVVVMALPFRQGWLEDWVMRSGVTGETWGVLLLISLPFVILLNIFATIINLLPIPSLDGYGIIEPWLPPAVQAQLQPLRKYGIWVLIGLLWLVPPVNQALWGLTSQILAGLNVPLEGIGTAHDALRQYSIYLILGLVLLLWIFADKTKQLYQKGCRQVSGQQYSQAIATFEQILAQHPQHVEALQMKGYTLYLLGEDEAALKLQDQAIAIQPDFLAAWETKAAILMHLGQLEETLAAYDKALNLHPDALNVWYNRGLLLMQLKRYEEALAAFDHVLFQKPDSPDAALQRGVVLEQLNRNKEALETYELVTRIKPDSTGWMAQMRLLEKLERYEDAIALCNNRLKVHPDDPQLWHRLGQLYQRLNRNSEAQESFDRMLACYDWLAKHKAQDPQVWVDRAEHLEELQRPGEANRSYQQAIALYEKTVQRHPQDLHTWYKLGQLQEKLNDSAGAIAAYEKVLQRQPDSFPIWYGKGMLHQQLQQYPEAIAAFKQFLHLRPDHAGGWLIKGQLLAKMQRLEEAITAYDQAIALFPPFYGSYFWRGYALYALQSYEGAIASFEQAIERNPDFADAWYNKACCLVLQGNQVGAIGALRSAIRLGGDRLKAVAKGDRDWDGVRSEAEFQALLG